MDRERGRGREGEVVRYRESEQTLWHSRCSSRALDVCREGSPKRDSTETEPVTPVDVQVCARAVSDPCWPWCEWDYTGRSVSPVGAAAAAAGGNMRLPSVFLLLMLLGLCSCTSFPSNINIGEWAAGGLNCALLLLLALIFPACINCIMWSLDELDEKKTVNIKLKLCILKTS